MKAWMIFAGGGVMGAMAAAVVLAGTAQGDTADAARIASLEARIATLERAVSVDANQGLSLGSGKKLVLAAGDEISLSTGKAKLRMRKSGEIELTGTDITIDGSSDITVKASKDVLVKGRKIGQN